MFATIHAWWTILLMVVFIGIVVWAYSGARKQDFDEAARLALDDETDARARPSTAAERGKGDAHG